MTYLVTLTDKDVFKIPGFSRPDAFEQRVTVKAVVRNFDGKFALVTNDVHGVYLLPGGGAESNDLENEISRECMEEIGCMIKLIGRVGQTREFRYREAKEYRTTCFTAEVTNLLTEDMRTSSERDNNLRVEWMELDSVRQIFIEQKKAVQKGDIKFYNTAFNILRDGLFFERYSEKDLCDTNGI